MYKETITDILTLGDSSESPIISGEFYVTWDISIEWRSWGLKSINAFIISLTGYFLKEQVITRTTVSGDSYEEIEEIEEEFNSEKWKIETDYEETIPVYPTSIEFDFKKKKVMVIF